MSTQEIKALPIRFQLKNPDGKLLFVGSVQQCFNRQCWYKSNGTRAGYTITRRDDLDGVPSTGGNSGQCG